MRRITRAVVPRKAAPLAGLRDAAYPLEVDDEPPAPLSELPVLVFFVACLLLGGYSGAAIGHQEAGVPGAAVGLALGLVLPWVPVWLRRVLLRRPAAERPILEVEAGKGPLRPVPEPGPEQWIPALEGGGLTAFAASLASIWYMGPAWLTTALILAAMAMSAARGYLSVRKR